MGKIGYRLHSIEPEGLWTSESFPPADRRYVVQDVIAGFLSGHPRWATTLDGSFIYGLDARGNEIKSAPSHARKKAASGHATKKALARYHVWGSGPVKGEVTYYRGANRRTAETTFDDRAYRNYEGMGDDDENVVIERDGRELRRFGPTNHQPSYFGKPSRSRHATKKTSRHHATKSEIGPRVLKIGRDKTFAALRSIAATIQYPGEPSKRVEFVGPNKRIGGSGPVVMIMGGYETFVTDPSRFGDFGPEWVRRFFED